MRYTVFVHIWGYAWGHHIKLSVVILEVLSFLGNQGCCEIKTIARLTYHLRIAD